MAEGGVERIIKEVNGFVCAVEALPDELVLSRWQRTAWSPWWDSSTKTPNAHERHNARALELETQALLARACRRVFVASVTVATKRCCCDPV